MIDIKNVKNKFEEYVSNYNPQNERIKLKIEHIERVAKNCEIISKNLNLSKDEINLATSIGYFHDIGRFEQVRRSNTFSDRDSGINHGELSATVLFENNFIRDFILNDTYDKIIKTAIINHNKPHIENGLSEKELLFSKIIRDADKLDIFYTSSNERYSKESIFWYDNFDCNEINKEMMEDFENEHFAYYSKIKTNADLLICFYAYIFNLNFPISLKILYDNKYLEKLTIRAKKIFNSKIIHSQLDKLLTICYEYLNSQNTVK